MQDDMVVRAKPLVLVIGFIEAMFELLVQGHDMVRLRDWFESPANKAGLSASWLKFQTGSSDPSTLLRRALGDQLALHRANTSRKHGALRWIQELVRPRYPLLKCFALKEGKVGRNFELKSLDKGRRVDPLHIGSPGPMIQSRR
ncbi:hypothetical protein ASG57_26085 [Bradyrhizobium sp. Leaf396]|nr:hypothetical protein ASG57_26085 [Bradyrhizobium sp. Leaf396]